MVKKGYYRIAEVYQANRHRLDNMKQLRELASLLPKNAKILDAGCGEAVPVARFLVESGFQVIGSRRN